MAASSPVDGVRALAVPAAASAGLVVESVTITPAGRRRVLRVVVDLPDDAVGGVPLQAVSDASQALSDALDASDVMGGAPYVLEVSSPGADRPLTQRRHWSRARGRLVDARLADGGEVTGRLMTVDDAGVVIDGRRLSWERLGTARVHLEFSRPDDPELDELDGQELDESQELDGSDEEGEI